MCIMYPLVICYMPIENGPVEIVDYPINSMVIFNSYVNLYQRAKISINHNLNNHFIDDHHILLTTIKPTIYATLCP